MNKEKLDFSLNPIIKKIDQMLKDEYPTEGISLKSLTIRKHFEGFFIDYNADINIKERLILKQD